MIQHLDVLCGDATVDLSEELLFGDTGLLQSINMRKKVPHGHEAQGVNSLDSSNPDILQPSCEVQGVTTSEPSTSECLYTPSEVQELITSQPSHSDEYHSSNSLGTKLGATASSPVAESEPPKGRTVKVPERVSIHFLSLSYFPEVVILILGFLLVDILCILFVPLSDNIDEHLNCSELW